MIWYHFKQKKKEIDFRLPFRKWLFDRGVLIQQTLWKWWASMSVGGITWYREEGIGSFLSPISFFLSLPLGLGWPPLLQQRSLRYVLFQIWHLILQTPKLALIQEAFQFRRQQETITIPPPSWDNWHTHAAQEVQEQNGFAGREDRDTVGLETELQELLIQDHILLPSPGLSAEVSDSPGPPNQGSANGSTHRKCSADCWENRRPANENHFQQSFPNLPMVTGGEVSTNSFLISPCKEVSAVTKVTKRWGRVGPVIIPSTITWILEM